jgi:serine/threonine protein kinase
MKYMQLHRRNFLLHLQERAGYDRPVLLKEPALERPSATHLNQLHNEYAITRRLADVPGVRPAYAKEGLESHPVLLLSYIQGHSLAELVNASTPLDLTEKLRIAGEATEVLSRIHEQQVMHKDINPSNILMGEDGRVYIIDFGIATALRQESQPKISPDDDFAGTLAYISPEQTGRMNRPVDYRTDFYSLGATLYELFTGQRPFETGEALEMIHSHIARQPVPPQKIDAEIPQPISDIILKLLAKNAEARYQTARGLQADLKTCLDQWQTNGWIEPFELGRDDFTGRLQISPKLYGRQAEIEHLLSTFERVAQSKAELLLLAGCAGVGKTTLVHEIHKTITAKQGYFIEGKFDQYQRRLPTTHRLRMHHPRLPPDCRRHLLEQFPLL